jgi:hypothetical protein
VNSPIGVVVVSTHTTEDERRLSSSCELGAIHDQDSFFLLLVS